MMPEPTLVPAAARVAPGTPRDGNLILDHYHDLLPRAIEACVPDPAPVSSVDGFDPGFALPELTPAVRRFFAPAVAAWRPLGSYRGHRLVLLDLTGNPATHTTKTYASLLIVARAVEYLRRTGEPVVIFSPTSANKGVALRDAVLRALEAGLADPDQLRVVTLAPASCRDKLRGSRLSEEARLRARNPVLIYPGADPEAVKSIGREFVRRHAGEYLRRTGARLWYTLDLANYLVADTARAFFEQAVDPPAPGHPRLHAHAVSSAFGLLGYHQGRQVLEAAGAADPALRPASLLVQHLGAPDMVLHLRTGGFDPAGLPTFHRDRQTGLAHQSTDPHYPAAAYDPAEILDRTFYTHQPATSARMDEIIHRYGGDGIVVSLHECLQRYPALVALLAGAGRGLPADPRALREWSVVMALTGVCNAVDRGLVAPDREIVVHGSGWYTAADCPPLTGAVEVTGVDEVAEALLERA
jgi:Family of unknown function (DUF6002)